MRFYFGTPGWGWKMFGFGWKTSWFFGLSIRAKAPEQKLDIHVHDVHANY